MTAVLTTTPPAITINRIPIMRPVSRQTTAEAPRRLPQDAPTNRNNPNTEAQGGSAGQPVALFHSNPDLAAFSDIPPQWAAIASSLRWPPGPIQRAGSQGQTGHSRSRSLVECDPTVDPTMS